MKKHFAITLIILGITAWAHLSIQQAQAEAGLRRPPANALNIPETIGPYKRLGEDQPIDERVKEVLETSMIMQRTYMSPRGLPINLSIVYAGASRRSLHFPQVCLVGAGYEIREQETIPIGFDFDATRLILAKGHEQQAVIYWFKTSDNFTGNFFLNSFYWAKEQIVFGAPTSAMIKLSANINDSNQELVFSILEDFASKLGPVLLENVK